MIVGILAFVPILAGVYLFQSGGYTFIDDGVEERQSRRALAEYLKGVAG